MCRVSLRSIRREKPRMNTEDKDIISLRIEMLEFVIRAVLRFAEEDDTGAVCTGLTVALMITDSLRTELDGENRRNRFLHACGN